MNTLILARERKIATLHAAFHTIEGDGFEVRRAIPSSTFEAIGPFIFLDHFGPIEVRPGEAKGASAHPHAGRPSARCAVVDQHAERRQAHRACL